MLADTLGKIKSLWSRLPEKARVWLLGLFGALQVAVAGAVSQFLFGPEAFSISQESLSYLWASLIGSSLAAVRLYLRQSPLKPVIAEIAKQEWDGIDRRGNGAATGGGNGQ